MRRIEIKQITIENFKGIKKIAVPFFHETEISGKNASGKTTIFDALTWLLFGKDSLGNEKFSVRPLNPDGTMVDGVEIAVTALISADGRDYELKKTQKQNWVKKRGSETAVFQGNSNSYEIDGYPKTEAEFKLFVDRLIDENLFKILTSPMYFPNMKWQEQRAMLMSFLTNETDVEIAKKLGGFEELLPDLEIAPSIEDIRAKYAKALKEFRAKQKELPVRIDELEKSRVVIDVDALKKEKAEIVQIVAKIAEEEEEAARQYKTYQAVKEELLDLKREAYEIERKANDRNREAKYTADLENRKLELTKETASAELNRRKQDVARFEEEIKRREAELKEINERKMPENFVCPVCGRKYGQKRIDEIKARFDKEKNEQFDFVAKNLCEAELNLKDAESKVLEATAKINELAELKPITAFEPVDYTQTPEWIELKKKVSEKEEYLLNQEDTVWQMENFGNIKRSHQDRVFEINQELAKADAMTQISGRIEELRSELKEVGQLVSDQEKMLYLLDSFINKKLDLMSEQINGKFDGVEWTLFERQINGGIKETCVCTVNGVPYGSVNSGHKIVAGLQIIKALQNRYGVSAPIFIDNAESINRENIPEMSNQMIFLTVTDGDLEVK